MMKQLTIGAIWLLYLFFVKKKNTPHYNSKSLKEKKMNYEDDEIKN